MFDLKSIVEKEKKQEEGVWRDVVLDGKAVGRVQIAALSNMTFAEALEKETTVYKRRNNISARKDLTSKQTLEVMVRCLAKVTLKDWGPLKDGDPFPVLNGETLECTFENKLRLLDIWGFRSAIQELAIEIGDATYEDLESDLV